MSPFPSSYNTPKIPRRARKLVRGLCCLLVVTGLWVAGAPEAQAQCTNNTPGSGSYVVYQGCTEAKGSNNSLTLNVPGTPSAGDLLIVSIGLDGNPTVTANSPSDWISLGQVSGGNNATRLAVFYRIASGSDAASYQFNFSASEDYVGIMMRFTGASGNFVTQPASGTGNPARSPSVNTTGNSTNTNNTILRLISWDDDDTTDNPATILASHVNINQDSSGNGNGTTAAAAAYINQVAAGASGTADFEAVGEQWAALTIAIEPAPNVVSPFCTAPTDGSGSNVIFESCQEAKGVGVTSISPSTPSGIANDDLLVAVVAVDGDVTVSTPAGWTKESETVSNSAVTLAIYTRVVQGGEASDYTFSWTGFEDVMSYIMHFSGTTGSYVASATNTGTTGAPEALSVNTTGNSTNANNNLILRIAAWDGDAQAIDPVTIVPGHNNINQDESTAAIGAVASAAAYVSQVGAGDSGSAFFVSGTVPWAAQTLAIEPPAGPTTDPVCPGINGTVVGNQLVVIEDCSEAKLNSSVNDITISTPATTAAGDLLLVAVASDDDETVTDVSASWTVIDVGNAGNSGPTLAMYYKFAGVGDASGLGSYTFSTGAEEKYAYMLRLTGASGILIDNVQIGDSTTAIAPAITTAAPNTLVIRTAAIDQNSVTPDPSTIVAGQRNITSDYSSTNSGSVSMAGVYVSQDAVGGSGTVNIPLTDSESWRAVTVGVEPVEFLFSHDGSMSLCAIEEVTISVVNSVGNLLTNFTGTVDLSTSGAAGGNGAWAVGSTGDTAQGTLDNTTGGATDNGQATYTFVSGDNGTVTLEFTTDTAGALSFDLEWDLGLRSFRETQTVARDPQMTALADCEFRITHGGTGGTCGAVPVTITLVDGSGATATNYDGQTVTITQNVGTGGNFAINTGNGSLTPDPDNDNNGAVQYTFVAADNGQVVLNYTNSSAGTINFDVNDATNGFVTDTDLPASYDPNLVISSCEFRLVHDGASDVCSLQPITLQVTDATGALITGFTGVVTLTNSATAGTWSVNSATNALVSLGSGSVQYTFSALDAGDIVLNYQLLQTNASINFNVTSTTPGIASPSGSYDPVLAVAACTAQISVSATTNVCSPSETVTLTVLNSSGGTPNGTIGTVVLNNSTSNGNYALPSPNPYFGVLDNGANDDGVATYTFNASDGNSIELEFSTVHVESLSFTASSTYITFDAAGSSENLQVLACEFRISHSGSSDVCTPETITIAVYNAAGAEVTDYVGTINLSTSTGNGTWANGTGDGTVTDPVPEDGNATYAFASTDDGFVELLFTDATAETVNINITDGVSSASNASFDPNLSIANCSFRITMVDQTMTACTSEAITITVYNSSAAVATEYTGTVSFSTSTLHGSWADAGALNGTLTDTTPGDGLATYAFDTDDNGVATFTFTNANVETVNINLQAGSIVENGSYDPNLGVTGCIPSIVNSACFPGTGPGTGSLSIGAADPGRMLVMLIFHIDGSPQDVTNATFNGIGMTQIAEQVGLNTSVEMWGILNANLPSSAGSYPGAYTFDAAPANSPSMCLVELNNTEQSFPTPNVGIPSQGEVNSNAFTPDGAPLDMTTSITTSGNNAFIMSAGVSDFTQVGDSWFNAVSPTPPMSQYFFNTNDQNPANGTAGGSIGNKAVAGLLTVTDRDTQDAFTSAAHIVASFNPLVAGPPQATGFEPVVLFDTFSGNIAYKAIGSSMRTASNGSGGQCSFVPVGTGTTATLAMPAGSTVEAAYIYWAGSGEQFEADDTVSFGPSGSQISVTADDVFYVENVGQGDNLDYFAAYKNVTAQVTGNGDYTLSNLTVQSDAPWQTTGACAGGWALVAVYSNPAERFRVANLFHGFQPFQDSSFTLVPRNFRMATTDNPGDTPGAGYLPNGEVTHITIEGDEDIEAGNEALAIQDSPGADTFTILTNSFNPPTGDFNSTVSRPIFSNTFGTGFYEFDSTAGINGDGYEIDQAGPDVLEAGRTGVEIGASWGFDIDTHFISGNDSSGELWNFAQPGNEAEAITTRYSSGQDLVMLISEVITVTNFDLADLEVFKSQAGDFDVNGTGSYTLTVTNNGNGGLTGGEATSQLILADILPTGMTLDSVSGTGWNCSLATTTAFSCTIDIANDCGVAEGCSTPGELAPGDSLAAVTANVIVGDTSAFPLLSNNVKNTVRLQANGGSCGGLTAGVIPDPTGCTRSPQFDNLDDLQGGAIDKNDLDDKSSENNNVASVITEVRGVETDLSITKVVNGVLEEGNSASYTITVTNNGPDATSGATDGIITVTDTQPAGVTFTSVVPVQPDWDCSLGPLTCTYDASLAVGASISFTLNVDVTGTQGQNVTNTAAVAIGPYNFDTISGNNSDTDVTAISPPLVSSNERFLLSVSVPGDSTQIGGLAAFQNDDLIIYNPVTDAGIMYFDNSARSYGVDDADATHLFKNGHIAFSAASSSSIGSNSLDFEPEDIVVWDPILETATMLFDGSAILDGPITADDNIDAVYVKDDGRILFSTAGPASLTYGGSTTVSWYQGDIIEYNPSDGTAIILIDTSDANLFGGEVQVDALYLRVDDSDADANKEVYILSINESTATVGACGTCGPTSGTTFTRDDIVEIDLTGAAPVTENLFVGDVPLGVFTPGDNDRTIDALHVVEDGYIGHFSIAQSQAGTTCQAGQITISKHKGLSHVVDTDYAGSIRITTDLGEGDWSIAFGSGTLSNGTADDGAAVYTFVPADNGQVTLYLNEETASTINVNVTNTFTRELAAEDPNFIFNDVITNVTYRDEWNNASYSNNDGFTSWDGDWIETDGAGAGPAAGNIQADTGVLEMTSTMAFPTPSIIREFDLSSFQVTQNVLLNFDYSYEFLNSGSDVLTVDVSGDGGDNWTTVHTFSGIGSSNPVEQSLSLNITSDLGVSLNDFGPDNAQVRFAITGGYTGTSRMFFDDIEIATGTTNCGVGSLHHYEIAIEGQTSTAVTVPGIACVGTLVTITGHNLGELDVAPAETIALSVGPNNKGDWTLVSGTGAFNNGALGDGAATYTFPPGEVSATFYLNYTDPTSDPEVVNINVTSAYSESANEDPSLAVAQAGLLFSTRDDGVWGTGIPLQIAGKASNVPAPSIDLITIEAVRSSDNDPQACSPLFDAGTTISMQFAAECLDPSSCAGGDLSVTSNLATISATAGNDNAGAGTTASYETLNVQMVDNGNGHIGAPLVLNYNDVGQIELHARYSIPLANNPAGIDSTDDLVSGNGAFVVRPFGFSVDFSGDRLNNIDSSYAANASGTAFEVAGNGFDTTVRAVLYDAADDDDDSNGIPDETAELWDNTTAQNFGNESTDYKVVVAATVTAPANSTGTLSNNEFTTFVSGAQTHSMTFDEVGIIDLDASLTDLMNNPVNYLNGDALDSYETVIGLINNVGRFYPSSFELSGPMLTSRVLAQNPVDGQCIANPNLASGTDRFTYLGEEFEVSFTLTARNLSGVRTENYTDGFAKLGGEANDLNASAFAAFIIQSGADFELPGAIGIGDTPVTISWPANAESGRGIAAVSGNLIVGKNSVAVGEGPYENVTVGYAAVDSDGAAVAVSIDIDEDTTNDYEAIATENFRYGRLVIDNAYGPETEPLPIFFRIEYFDGDNFVTNTVDNCTVLTYNGSETVFTDRTLEFVTGTFAGGLAQENGDTNQDVGESVIELGAVQGSNDLYSSFYNGQTRLQSGVDLAPVDSINDDVPFYASAPEVAGSALIEFDLNNADLPYSLDFLSFDWRDAAENEDISPDGTADNPRARVEFGTFRGHDRIINWQEIFIEPSP